MSPISSSPNRTEPDAGTNPQMAFISVDLPAPLLPMSPTISRSLTLTVAPSTATFPPKVTLRSETASVGTPLSRCSGSGRAALADGRAVTGATSLPNRRSAQAKMASRAS